MGDQTGKKDYHTISSNSIDKWKQAVDSHARKYAYQCYLRAIADRYVEIWGATKAKLEQELKQVPVHRFGLVDYIDFQFSQLAACCFHRNTIWKEIRYRLRKAE